MTTKRTYKPGIMSTGNYIVSGTPFMTGALVPYNGTEADGIVIEFPSVTKSINIVNKAVDYNDENFAATDIIVYFQSASENPENGIGEPIRKKEYITLQGADTSLSMTIRTRRVFISHAPHLREAGGPENLPTSARVEIFAELTGIEEDIKTYNQVD